METVQLSLAIGLLLFLGILLTLFALSKKRLKLRERLDAEKKPTPEGGESVKQQVRRVLVSIGQKLPRSPQEMSRQEKKLAQAGYRRKDAVLLFHGFHIAVMLASAGALTMTGLLHQQPIFFILLSVVLGALIPDLWLRRAMAQRRESIQCALPDAMDLAVIAVEAGLGLDQALMRVGEEIKTAHPAFSDELRLRNLEINMGRSRADALRNLTERTGVEDLKALVAILIQTDKFGTSVGQALRTFSDSLRTKRRQRAEEKAAQLAIKMVVPMILFIFPGVFIVILGPAFITIISDLLPNLASGK